MSAKVKIICIRAVRHIFPDTEPVHLFPDKESDFTTISSGGLNFVVETKAIAGYIFQRASFGWES